MNKAVNAMLSGAVCALVGCASGGGKIEVGDEKSFDGLLKVTNTNASAAWVYPDFDLSGYSKVKLEGAGIEFRPVRNRSRSSASRSGEGFPLSQSAQRRLAEIMREAFESQLARSERFQLTTEVGPDVLTVWGGLLDVVSFVPPDRAGRSDIFLRRVGEATLVLELRDSESNRTLARVMDRRAAERASSGAMHSNSVNNTAEVRRMANTWARLLRQRLDESPSLYRPAEAQ
jgi:hypothetical protein